jgi:hypothetical protein
MQSWHPSQNPPIPIPTVRQGHLALLKRWYYRPEARRSGEIFFPDPKAAGLWMDIAARCSGLIALT